MKISDISSLSYGSTVDSVVGQVISVEKPRGSGSWSLQNITISDERGRTLKVMLNDFPQELYLTESAMGRWVEISAGEKGMVWEEQFSGKGAARRTLGFAKLKVENGATVRNRKGPDVDAGAEPKRVGALLERHAPAAEVNAAARQVLSFPPQGGSRRALLLPAYQQAIIDVAAVVQRGLDQAKLDLEPAARARVFEILLIQTFKDGLHLDQGQDHEQGSPVDPREVLADIIKESGLHDAFASELLFRASLIKADQKWQDIDAEAAQRAIADGRLVAMLKQAS